MATSDKLIEAQSEGAHIFRGEAVCKEKITEILQEFSLPDCVLPLQEIIEFGFNRSSGFIWLTLDTEEENRTQVQENWADNCYDVEITALVAQRHLKKLTGVKTKGMLVSVAICEVIVGYSSDDKIKFVTSAGWYRVHPLSALEAEDESVDSK